ncbi:MAG: hypothetical protein V1835_04100, partial [Candidatus Micrarchaeota archaeon]
MKKLAFTLFLLGILIFGCVSPPQGIDGNLTKTANAEKNITLPANLRKGCEDVKGVLERDACFLNISKLLGNHTGCLRIIQTDLKDECFSAIANTTANVTLCAEVEINETQIGCYAAFGDLGKQLSLCYRKGEVADSCISLLGKSKNYSALCEYVNRESMRNECYAEIAA